MPRGYASKKHTNVLMIASITDLFKAFKYPGFSIVVILSKVNAPSAFVSP